MNERYLINIAIGPVQEFIATARRSRDLWFGSWLLSELSKAAAKKIFDQPGAILIFPAVDLTGQNKLGPGSEFNVVNKLTALIETDKLPEDMSENKKVAKFASRIRGGCARTADRIEQRGVYQERQKQPG